EGGGHPAQGRRAAGQAAEKSRGRHPASEGPEEEVNIKKITVGAAGFVLAASAVSGCQWLDGNSTTYYTPAAYYQTGGGVYECYSISQMAEPYALENAGLCPTYAIPTPMPLSWEEMYWDYYSSAAYYNT